LGEQVEEEGPEKGRKMMRITDSKKKMTKERSVCIPPFSACRL